MFNSFRTSRMMIAAMALGLAASAANAGVVTSNAGVNYDATLTTNDASKGGELHLTIDATGRYTSDPWGILTPQNDNLKYATELDQIKFTMKRLTGGSMTGASTGDVADWTAKFDDNFDWGIIAFDDYLTFTAKNKNHTLITSPLAFDFVITGTGLDFGSLKLTTEYLTQIPQYNKHGKLTGYKDGSALDYAYLNVTTQGYPVEQPPVNDVPEPASLAMMGLGLGMVGFMRRRKTAA